MKAQELRDKFLKFFEDRGHKVIPSASLVPENDPTVLFTTAGMHPLVPFLLGESHPEGKRLVNIQKCIRTDDIEEVGDATHNTFFEMLGYWSMGDYFKKDSIKYTLDFYTQILGFNKDKISVTVFKGDEDAPFDEESYNTWKDEIGIPDERIFKYGKKENWWGLSSGGPCGPDTEMFIDTGIDKCCDNCGPNCDCGKYVEIGNNVFMEYNKTADGKFEPLKQKNVDVGLGFERLLMFSESKNDVYETELFEPIIKKLEELSGKKYQDNLQAFRIIADHFRASVFAISDNALPSNKDRGYIVRRLLRRAIRYGKILGIEKFLSKLYPPLLESGQNPAFLKTIKEKKDEIIKIIDEEEEKFIKNLKNGLQKAEELFKDKKALSMDKYSKIMQLKNKGSILKKIYHNLPGKKSLSEFGIEVSDDEVKNAYITGKEAFNLYQSYGFPKEMIMELVQAKGLFVSFTDFKKELAKHQNLSRKGAEKKFKGGLADNKEQTTKLHTAAHLLLASLKKVLSPDVEQKGANITEERLRFDFNWLEKLNDEQIKKVEDLVNSAIEQKIAS